MRENFPNIIRNSHTRAMLMLLTKDYLTQYKMGKLKLFGKFMYRR